MKNILLWALIFVFLTTITISYGQNYPTTQQGKTLINLYKQADRKGLPVIGSGAPAFTPGAKQSRVYVDSVAGNVYCRNGAAWVVIAGTDDGNNAAERDLEQTGNRYYNGKGYNYTVDSIGSYLLTTANLTQFMAGDISISTDEDMTVNTTDDFIIITEDVIDFTGTTFFSGHTVEACGSSWFVDTFRE